MSLKKDLTLSQLTMIAIGSCIGSGIFITPANIVSYVPNYFIAMAIWCVGGLIAFLGAMTFSELGARYPGAGGVYVYLKEGYGPLSAFLYGWATLLIINTGALAALSMGLVDFLSFFIHIESSIKTLLAAAIILLLTGINILGVKLSGQMAQVFTGLKLLALLMIIVVGFAYSDTTYISQSIGQLNTEYSLLQAMLLALVGVFWSFGGWHHATYLSGETATPRKTIPRAMIIGTITVTAVYLLANLSFMFLLPPEIMGASQRVAGDALATVFGFGGKAVAIAIIISILGTISIYTMTAPRIYYSMAEDGVFFEVLSKVHPTFRTPYLAMAFQAFWAILLLFFWGSFVKIITFVTFMDIAFMVLAASTIFIFRRRSSSEELPFLLAAYPWIPLLYLLVTVAFVFNTMVSLNTESMAGILILLVGLPVYYFFKRRLLFP